MDSIVDGNINYQIITSNTVSADPNFNGLIVPDLNVVNLDEGITNPTTPTSPITYSVITSPISGLSTSESGTTSNLTLKLSAQPGANVTINLFSSNPLEGAVSPNTVTFTTTDWNTPKMFTVTGLDDQVADGHINYQIITSNTISSDSNFNGLIVPDFNVTNLDVGEKITFVTSMEYDGSLGGIAGADAKCNEASNKPTILPNVYKALLVHSTQRRATTVSGGSGSSSVGQFDWVFKPNTAYFQMNKTTKIVQTNVNGLYNLNSIDNQFDLNGGVYWTGLLNTWLVGVNCTDWTVTTGNGDIGFGNATNNTALAGASPQLCNTAANRRLLCIQQ
jgi:hypothetical protein